MKIKAGSLAELNQWIPAWFSSLSLSRGQIVVDQIRGLLERSARCRGFQVPLSDRSVSSPLIFLICTDSKGQRFAVLAVQSFSAPSGHLGGAGGHLGRSSGDQSEASSLLGAKDAVAGLLGDSATILHAGAWVDSSSNTSFVTMEIPRPLILALDETLSHQGVRFLQWATDADSPDADGDCQNNTSVSQACQSFGMRPLASLEYLSVALEQLTLEKLDRSQTRPANNPLKDQRLELVNVNHEDPDRNSDAFESLVSRTYQDTLDCPALSQFRTASQTLRSYRDVDSYDRGRWYFVVPHDDPSVPWGCVIMATHGGNRGDDNLPTSELVYMALLPEKRGHGLGRPLVKLALSEPSIRFGSKFISNSKSPQVVLAVDQQNTHARQLYLDAGLRPLLIEKVWGKSVGDTLSTTT